MALKVYQTIQDQVLQPFQDFATNGAGQISSEVGRTLTAAMTVYICWYGWMILRGSIVEPVHEFTVRAMKLSVIAMLVLNVSTYKDMIADPLSSAIPDGISKLEVGEPRHSRAAVVERGHGDARGDVRLDALRQGGTVDGAGTRADLHRVRAV